MLAAFQLPFAFVALLGTIALAGMIMRNSVSLIDQIDQYRADCATHHRAAAPVPYPSAKAPGRERRMRASLGAIFAALLAGIPTHAPAGTPSDALGTTSPRPPGR